MLYVLYASAIILNLFAIKYLYNNKVIIGFTIITILLLWTWNTQGPDIYNYWVQYRSVDANSFATNGYQLFYNIIMNFFSTNGYSFYTYRFVVSLVALLIIVITISKMNANLNIVMVMYMLTQLFLDGVQIRNFFAVPFLVLGIYFIASKKKLWKIKYILSIACASLFHIGFVIYLVFLMIPSEDKETSKMIKTHAIIASILCVFFFFGRKYVAVLISFMNSVDVNRASSYSIHSTNLGPLIVLALQIVGIAVTAYLHAKINRISDLYSQSEYCDEFGRDKEFIKRLFWINVVGLYIVPLSFVQLTFYRLVRNLLLINFASFGIINKYYRKSSYIFLTAVVYLLIWQVAEFYILNTYTTIIEPFFINSMLLE